MISAIFSDISAGQLALVAGAALIASVIGGVSGRGATMAIAAFAR